MARGVTGRSGAGTIVLLALGVLAGVLGYGYWQNRADPLAVGSMVAGFRRQNELTVFVAQVVPVVTSRIDGVVDMLDREQTTIMPATVRYTVDMSRLADRDIRWNATTKVLEITVPPVVVQRPGLEPERARQFYRGVYIGRDSNDRLSRSNSIKAGREARTLARNPELLRLAQISARDAIARNAALFVRGAGVDAKVVVRFANEARPSTEQMDRSRSIEEVLANRG